MIMKQIKNYEKASGKLVNHDKSFFLTSSQEKHYRINRLRNCTGFMDKPFPLPILGVQYIQEERRIVTLITW